jgi:D-ribose pyranase
MKRHGVLNSALAKALAGMGHTDRMVICDAGLPIPRGAECVDLAVTANIPRFLDVLKVVLAEGCFEGAVIAAEMEQRNPAVHGPLAKMLDGIPVTRVPHQELKGMGADACNTVYVRTGEASPFANIVLISGVTF